MITVLRKPIVARSLERLRQRKIHPLFAGYLHLQRLAKSTGRLKKLTPDFVAFFKEFFFVKDHPIGTPYIKPFTNQRASDKNLWLNENVAGSYAPSSLRPGQPFGKVVQVDQDKTYTLPHDHPKRALKYLLNGEPISAPDLSAFLFRDFGLLEDNPTTDDLLDVFAVEFGYANGPGAPRGDGFCELYGRKLAETWEVDPFETMSPEGAEADSEAASEGNDRPAKTVGRVRTLTAQDLQATEVKLLKDGPPLERVQIEGLLSFGGKTLFEFGRLNLLVGPNGSGKSNLIDCLRIIAATPVDLQSVFAKSGFESWLYNGLEKQSGSATLRVTVSIGGLENRICHELRLGPPSLSRAQIEEHITSDRTTPETRTPYFVGSYRSAAVLSVATGGKRRRERVLSTRDYNSFQSILSQIRDVDQYPEITRLSRLYSGFRIYSEWSFGRASRLREAAPAGRSDARLSESMDDLPVALNAMEQTAAHERVRELLRELKGSYRDYVTRILFGRVGLELVEVPFDTPIPANRLSDGTLRFLALAAILLQPDPPPVICLEEPELGMHPDMIRMVARMIAEAAARVQLIVTTHSEDLLTALQDDFDALFTFDASPKGSVVQRLSRQDFRAWRADHALGEIWSSGEIGGVRY